ncbi:hypothetical protein EDC04DRAFT_2600114 [Pisolithus marmoratus]|nr:hypothetical protein EDC04DRAFT_2600114 [Pisolithus marmoratus]
MSYFVYWPGQIFFYPLGNTSAICLTEDLPPEHKADVLLLGCGDPRHILYTVHADVSTSSEPRKLDVTCCDVDAAVLDTLSEIGRFWKLWLGTSNFNANQAKRFKEKFQDGMTNVRKHSEDIITTSMRSAGPLAPVTLFAVSGQFKHFWMTGATDDGLPAVKPVDRPNPTFAFFLFGDEFAVHYGTDPVSGFHLAEALASSGLELSNKSASAIHKLVQAARQQFSTWCKAVVPCVQNSSASSASLTVRMYAGEALAFCQALHYINTSVAHTPIFVAPWRRAVVQLDDTSYSSNVPSPAPTSFNVIETSNLLDHLGFLNLLSVTIPLLSDSPSSTLYTEALLPAGDSPAQGILDHVCGDLSTISLLLGVVPSAYVSRFTTRSNTSETMMLALAKSPAQQYHQRLARKHINFGHPSNSVQEIDISFTPPQLAGALFDIYLKMFSDEDPRKRMAVMLLDESQALRKIRSSGRIHYSRRSFALLLAHIRTRVRCDWDRVTDDLEALVLQDRTLLTGSNFYQEMACQLYLAGFHLSWLQEFRPQEDPSIFRSWTVIPTVVTVVLVVPRHVIAKVQAALSDFGTPTLQCEIRVDFRANAFACISVSFGKLEVSGQDENKVAVVIEDRAGINSTSPLIVSFPILSTSLIHTSGGTVGLAVRSTLATAMLTRKLGIGMCLFKALLTDERTPTTKNDTINSDRQLVPQLNAKSQGHPIHVEMNKYAHPIARRTRQASLTSGCAITVEQLSMNTAKLHVDQYQHTVSFPLPVDATNAKLRVARKSKYVEVIVPMTLTLDVKEESNVAGKFRTTFDGGIPTLWSIHRVNLDRCPSFKPSRSPKAFKWLDQHVGLMFSHRERRLRAQSTVPGSIPDTFMNLKDSLHTFFITATGMQGPTTRTEFALLDPEENRCYATILVTDDRLDIGPHTVVADSWIMPGSNDTQNKLKREILFIKTDAYESEAWRHLLPLLIERCRTWKHKPGCEYLVHNSIPLYPGAGSDPKKLPWCSCGMGIGTEVLRERYGSALAECVTRAAIGPLFPVSYIEKVQESQVLLQKLSSKGLEDAQDELCLRSRIRAFSLVSGPKADYTKSHDPDRRECDAVRQMSRTASVLYSCWTDDICIHDQEKKKGTMTPSSPLWYLRNNTTNIINYELTITTTEE